MPYYNLLIKFVYKFIEQVFWAGTLTNVNNTNIFYF